MSLEQKIELLTEAVVELTRVMQLKPNPITTMWEGPGNQVKKHEPRSVVEELKKEEAPNDSPKSNPTTDTLPPSSNESRTVTYDDVKNVTIAVSKIDKAKAVAGLARFGVTTAKALNESQWLDYTVYMERVQKGEIEIDRGASNE